MEKKRLPTFIKYKTISRSTAMSLFLSGVMTEKQYRELIKTGKTS